MVTTVKALLLQETPTRLPTVLKSHLHPFLAYFSVPSLPNRADHKPTMFELSKLSCINRF